MKGNHYYGWENSSKPRKLPWRLNITYWQKCFLCYKFAKQMFVYYTRYEKVCIYFCLYYHPANWELHSWFANWARSEVENGSPFTWLHSALNKKKKNIFTHILCKGQFFLLWKKENLLKNNPSVQHYWHFKEFITSIWEPGGTREFILLWEWQGEISLPRIYLYTVVLLCHCLDLPFLGAAL